MPVIQKVKEIVDSGTIGKILSTNIVSTLPAQTWGPQVTESMSYIAAASSACLTLLRPPMDCVQHVLGDFASISASTSIMYPTITIVGAEGSLTGKTLQAETPDHIVCAATLESGALASMIWRRRRFLWEIDGEKGCIRLEGDELTSSILSISNPNIYLNGELMNVPGTAEGPMRGLTSAWTEFAKGDAGRYPTLDDAVKLRRLLDVISRSAKEGRRIEVE
ncbi:hypothetical protein BD779DRAFT_1534750 [Infundibulicybe gibba]|nr:hypothetical protein BD779DRAFT_1534750 [Infundibulicybe gibba]